MILIVDLLNSRLVRLSLGYRELLVEKILCLDLCDSVVLGHTALDELCEGLGCLDYLGMKIGIDGSEELALHPHLTEGGCLKEIHTTKQGGLTRAGRADNGNDLALVNSGGYALQHLELTEVFIYAFNIKHEP